MFFLSMTSCTYNYVHQDEVGINYCLHSNKTKWWLGCYSFVVFFQFFLFSLRFVHKIKYFEKDIQWEMRARRKMNILRPVQMLKRNQMENYWLFSTLLSMKVSRKFCTSKNIHSKIFRFFNLCNPNFLPHMESSVFKESSLILLCSQKE